jgi:hypothetical protein
MQKQLNRMEKKLDTLIVSVEHRLTNVETTQRGIKWLICVFIAVAISVALAL